MKKAIILWLAVAFLFTLAGCENAADALPEQTGTPSITEAITQPHQANSIPQEPTLPEEQETETQTPEAETAPDVEIRWEWEYDAPENHSFDSAALAGFYAGLDATQIQSALIVKDSVIIGEYYKDGFDETSLFVLHSCSKSVTGALVGIAIDQGLIEGVDVLISEYFPQILESGSDGQNQITLRHLLTHSSGISWNESDIYYSWRDSENWVDFVLSRPMASQPGATFDYSTGNSHLLAAIVQQAAGRTLYDFGKEYLFDPLGMDSVQCGSDPQGISDGGNGFIMNVYDMAKLGRLYCNGGQWEGEQIVPQWWVEASTGVQFTRSSGSAHYGYQWWVRTFGGRQYDAYFAQGHFGQYIFVIPGLDLIICFTSHHTGGSGMYWQLVEDIVGMCHG